MIEKCCRNCDILKLSGLWKIRFILYRNEKKKVEFLLEFHDKRNSTSIDVVHNETSYFNTSKVLYERSIYLQRYKKVSDVHI